ncbi:MAG: DUF1893 domain-containing protein [Bacteroidales bacterium]|nr:DUF1893 domain-containing protein [Bacteroidales bacterium]MCD8393624.1 DUF1893 domain-containing protein [Bacteroidales bacterium]
MRECDTLVVITPDGAEHHLSERGVAPLYQACMNGWLKGAKVVDKVSGLGAAVVMARGGVTRYYTRVVSRKAMAYLEARGIPGEALEVVDGIINRRGDGPCPLEARLSRVAECDYWDEIVAFIEEL